LTGAVFTAENIVWDYKKKCANESRFLSGAAWQAASCVSALPEAS
jgi:hypothetical protein